MKLYKSLLFGLLMCGFAACDTTDLERDINSLKDRVENYEAQVQKLNDDMNIIRVLLDGNKTITSYSFDGANYTLTLSNGETLTLTQGVVGANYPSITIGENGNWIIAGEDSGVKAKAEDGADAAYTPQFKVENENWWVSLDGGASWSDLGVKATGTTSGATSPISNVTSSDNSLVIMLSNGQSYTIPVIQDLVCEITEPELADGDMWYIGCGATATLKVKVNIKSGDIVRPVVPADWKAVVTTDYASLSGEQTLEVEVTAPATASKCVVTMEVIRGVNTVTDEIVARTEIANYWDEYQAGFDIVIGNPNGTNFIINKQTTSLEVKHITSESSDKTINSSGIYFVDEDVTAIHERFGISDLIIIGTNPKKCSKLQSNDYFNLSKSGKGLILKNLEVDFSFDKDYIINEGNEEANLEYVMFDNCRLELSRSGSGKSLYLLNIPTNNDKQEDKTKIHISNISFYSNKIKVSTVLNSIYMVRFQSPLEGNKFTGYESCEFVNNIFYFHQGGSGCDDFSLLQANMKDTYMDAITNITVSNNTIVNLLSKNGMVRSRMTNIISNNNLIWNDNNVSSNPSWICAVKRSDESLPHDLEQIQISNNICYDKTDKTWMMFHSSYYRPDNYTDYTFNYLEKDPFTGGTFDIANGIFKVSADYEGIGSSLE